MTQLLKAPPASKPGAPARTGPFSPRYLGFVSGMSLSSLGDAAWAIGLSWTLISSAGPGTAGAVLAIATLPKLITLLGGGAAADSRGPRQVMVTTDLGRCGLMLVAAAVVVATGPTIPVVLAVAVLLSLMSAFFTPASGALRPLLLEKEDLVRGNSLFLLGLRGGQTIGAPVGAFLMGVGGFVLVAVANAVSYLVSAFAVWQAKPIEPAAPPAAPPAAAEPVKTRPAQAPLWTRIGEGLRYVARDPRLRLVVIILGLTELAGTGPANLGFVVLAGANGSGVGGAGLMLASFTIGATVSFLAAIVWPPKRFPVLAVVGGTALQAIGLASLGLVTSLSAACVVYFELGFVSAFAGVILVSLLQRWADKQIRGRVMSIMALVLFATVPVGNLAFGVLVELIGIAATMGIHAALAATATIIYLSSSDLRSERVD